LNEEAVLMAVKKFKEPYAFRLFTAVMFLALTICGIAFSVYLFTIASSINMVLLAVLFLILSIVSGFFNVYAALLYCRSYSYQGYVDKITEGLKPLKRFPTVAIAVPVFNEDAHIVKRNVLRFFELNYPKNKLKVYLVDDSTDKDTVKELSSFCKENGVVYLHRTDRAGFKACALNNMLKICNEEFVAIFDYDEYITNRNFLVDLLPYFSDKRLAYVQTEKTAFKGTFFSDSIRLFDAFFYKFIQPARALNNTAIFAGSCGIIRKSTLDELGGFPECVIEDTFFSFESDAHKFKGLYIPKIYAYGRPITTFSAVVKQQWRYNYGDTQFLSYFFKRRPDAIKHLSPISNVDYITHGFGLNYLSVILVMFTITSVFIVFSGLPLLHLSLTEVMNSASISMILELFGGVAFVLSVLTPVLLTKLYFGSFKKGFMVFVLNFALAVARTKAAFSALVNKDPGMNWYRTKIGNKHNLLFSLRNTVVELLMSFGLLAIGLFAMLTSNVPSGIWLLWYGVMYMAATILLYKYG
jgi:cellulose synthase/poly-beta-1,6-N-acetylglucosamine synthase-like glycosyltransferase